jgi:DNA-binding NarL/FixJ family response regulator
MSNKFANYSIREELYEIISSEQPVTTVAEFTNFAEARHTLAALYPTLSICSIDLKLNVSSEATWELKAYIYPVLIDSRAYAARQHFKHWENISKASLGI